MKPQPLTRVFIIADSDAEARKLVQFFRESHGFAVSGFGLADRLLQVKGDVDVILVHSRELGQIPALSQATVPILCLVQQGETRTLKLNRASAVLRQDASPAQIRAATAALAAGLHVESLSATALHNDGGADFTLQEALTDREIGVLNLIAEGLTNPEIARRLSISRNTVKFHVSSIIAKLGATSRTDAVTLGMKRGLIIV
jgi:DNA-binding NarL/FixJ family response regulator